MPERQFQVRALGEIAIRTANMPAMVAFYRDVIGLELLSGDHRSDIVFFRIAESHAGHMGVLALFDAGAGRQDLHPRGTPVEGGAQSTLHHLALSLPHKEQDAVMAWYDANRVDYRVQEFDWIGWRGIFTTDPDGNTVELVAADPDHPARQTYPV